MPHYHHHTSHSISFNFTLLIWISTCRMSNWIYFLLIRCTTDAKVYCMIKKLLLFLSLNPSVFFICPLGQFPYISCRFLFSFIFSKSIFMSPIMINVVWVCVFIVYSISCSSCCVNVGLLYGGRYMPIIVYFGFVCAVFWNVYIS